ncbi:hypothetical protein [Streptomyces sp. NPDC093089]
MPPREPPQLDGERRVHRPHRPVPRIVGERTAAVGRRRADLARLRRGEPG